MATQAVPAVPPTSFALSEHRTLRVAVLFLLYVAHVLPFGLNDYGLPAWLVQIGASAAAISGVLAMIVLPWTFKRGTERAAPIPISHFWVFCRKQKLRKRPQSRPLCPYLTNFRANACLPHTLRV